MTSLTQIEALIFSIGVLSLYVLWDRVLGNGLVVKDRMGVITILFDLVETAFDSNTES